MRVEGAELVDMAAELLGPLDEEHGEADVSQADRRAHAGHAAADHERPRGRLDGRGL